MSIFQRFINLFAAKPMPKFVLDPTPQSLDPESVKRESRALALRAAVEKEAACLPETSYVECRKYGEHVIAQVNSGQVTLQAAYALVHGFISRRTHRLAPFPSTTKAA